MKIVLHYFRGERWHVSELAQISGVPAHTIKARVAAGWTVEQAVAAPTPVQRRAGVVSNLPAFEGTGAGSTEQETPNITFSQEAAE